MHPLVNIAVSAARSAGRIIMRELPKVDQLKIHSKGLNDFVTDVDRNAEASIIQTIHRAYPHHGILGEESGRSLSPAEDSDVTWIIDPLDGTTNYLHGFPQFAVSIGVQVRGRLEHGVVYNPYSQELFCASRGEGATLDGKRIRVSRAGGLPGSLIGTGFPFKPGQDRETYMQMMETVMMNTAGLRRAGAASLDLAFVAAGRLDGFWEMDLKPWDIAAGIVLIQEAGGLVAELSADSKDPLTTGNIVGGNLKVCAALVDTLRPLAR